MLRNCQDHLLLPRNLLGHESPFNFRATARCCYMNKLPHTVKGSIGEITSLYMSWFKNVTFVALGQIPLFPSKYPVCEIFLSL